MNRLSVHRYSAVVVRRYLLIALLFTCISGSADSLDTLLKPLKNHPDWNALLHFKPSGITGTLKSEADDATFFLSKHGSSDAYGELRATVEAFLVPVTTTAGIKDEQQDNAAACRFPARYHWIKHRLEGKLELPNYTCPAFRKWLAGFDAKSLTLIYPASYLNSPSSMYGHTLMRINTNTTSSTDLLAYSINYAATPDSTDNEIVFSWKGLTGGYPGELSVLRYYKKVKEYSAIENRDIWEYELDLNEEEVAQFLRHSWELQQIRFDYFFFDENCSYRLLTILDVATTRFQVNNHFRISAAPVDTIRILIDQGLVSTTHYRASMANTFKNHVAQTPEHLQAIATQLVDEPESINSPIYQTLTKTDKAKVLELAYGYIRYTDKREDIPTKNRSRDSLALLSARAKLGITSPFDAIDTPAVRDDEGHDSSRFTIGASHFKNDSTLTIGTRIAYHDLLDPSEGYPKGSEIEMGNIEIRLENNGNLKLEELGILNITSLSPRSLFFSPLSWRVSTGIKRYKNEFADFALAYLDGGSGVSYSAANGLLYALAEAELNIGSDIEKGYGAGLGFQLGYLIQTRSTQAKFSYQYRDFMIGGNYSIEKTEFSLSFNTSPNTQIRVAINQLDINRNGNLNIDIQYAHYF